MLSPLYQLKKPWPNEDHSLPTSRPFVSYASDCPLIGFGVSASPIVHPCKPFSACTMWEISPHWLISCLSPLLLNLCKLLVLKSSQHWHANGAQTCHVNEFSICLKRAITSMAKIASHMGIWHAMQIALCLDIRRPQYQQSQCLWRNWQTGFWTSATSMTNCIRNKLHIFNSSQRNLNAWSDCWDVESQWCLSWDFPQSSQDLLVFGLTRCFSLQWCTNSHLFLWPWFLSGQKGS